MTPEEELYHACWVAWRTIEHNYYSIASGPNDRSIDQLSIQLENAMARSQSKPREVWWKEHLVEGKWVENP